MLPWPHHTYEQRMHAKTAVGMCPCLQFDSTWQSTPEMEGCHPHLFPQPRCKKNNWHQKAQDRTQCLAAGNGECCSSQEHCRGYKGEGDEG